MEMQSDDQYMLAALRCASDGLFTTTPNPRVGCLIVKNDYIIGQGFTQPPGHHHAEIEALNDACSKGHDVEGATVYVTLEPCSHFGRTPPCVDALIKAKVARVVIAIVDPNPLVNQQGITQLKNAGIAVTCGVLADQALEINIGFFSRMLYGKPWVRLKMAASLDGKTALNNGESKWITSEAARDDGHFWRARACAVLTGIGTVMADDPHMTVRAIKTTRQPRSIIVDSALSISPDASILGNPGAWIVAAIEDLNKQTQLEKRGAEIILLPNLAGQINLPALMSELGKRQINELHIEAGPKLSGALIAAGCVDELLLYIAPSILGQGKGMFNMPMIDHLQNKYALYFHEIKQIGEDIRILARFSA